MSMVRHSNAIEIVNKFNYNQTEHVHHASKNLQQLLLKCFYTHSSSTQQYTSLLEA